MEHMAVLMEPITGKGECSLVSKNQIKPSCRKWAGYWRGTGCGRTQLKRPNSGANGSGKILFLCSADHKKDRHPWISGRCPISWKFSIKCTTVLVSRRVWTHHIPTYLSRRLCLTRCSYAPTLTILSATTPTTVETITVLLNKEINAPSLSNRNLYL